MKRLKFLAIAAVSLLSFGLAETASANANAVYYWLGVLTSADPATAALDARQARKDGLSWFKANRGSQDASAINTFYTAVQTSLLGSSTIDNSTYIANFASRTSPDKVLSFATRWQPGFIPEFTKWSAQTLSTTAANPNAVVRSDWDRGRLADTNTRRLINSYRKTAKNGLKDAFRSRAKSRIFGTVNTDSDFFPGAVATTTYNFFQGIANGDITVATLSGLNALDDIAREIGKAAARGRDARLATDRTRSNTSGAAAMAAMAQVIDTSDILTNGGWSADFVSATMQGVAKGAKKYALDVALGATYGLYASAIQNGFNTGSAAWFAAVGATTPTPDITPGFDSLIVQTVVSRDGANLRGRKLTNFVDGYNGSIQAILDAIAAPTTTNPFYGAGALFAGVGDNVDQTNAPAGSAADFFAYNAGTQNEVTSIR